MVAYRITASREGSGTSSLVALHPQRNLGAGPATDSEWYIIAARRRLMSAPNHMPEAERPEAQPLEADVGAAFRAAPGAGLTGNRARTRFRAYNTKKRRRKE